jgi:hypothetical protein
LRRAYDDDLRLFVDGCRSFTTLSPTVSAAKEAGQTAAELRIMFPALGRSSFLRSVLG